MKKMATLCGWTRREREREKSTLSNVSERQDNKGRTHDI